MALPGGDIHQFRVYVNEMSVLGWKTDSRIINIWWSIVTMCGESALVLKHGGQSGECVCLSYIDSFVRICKYVYLRFLLL